MPHCVLVPSPSALPHVVSSPQQHFAYIFVLLLLLHCPEKLKGLQEEEEEKEDGTAAAAKTGEERTFRGGLRNLGFSNIELLCVLADINAVASRLLRMLFSYNLNSF